MVALWRGVSFVLVYRGRLCLLSFLYGCSASGIGVRMITFLWFNRCFKTLCLCVVLRVGWFSRCLVCVVDLGVLWIVRCTHCYLWALHVGIDWLLMTGDL